ncbi:MAG: sugar nucleotide-binding protein, partial [Armatimonadetes bacterium]|nr:sugar nucleotide-binding protein [Armatimonadota bacterium]
LRVVDDQVCSRTYAPDLAAGLVELSGRRVAFGTYHLTNAGAGSWYEFAGTIAAVLGVEVGMTPVSSADWGAAALRPAYSVLSCAKWAAAGLAPLRDVRRAVAAYLCPRGAGEREGNVDE